MAYPTFSQSPEVLTVSSAVAAIVVDLSDAFQAEAGRLTVGQTVQIGRHLDSIARQITAIRRVLSEMA